MEPHEYSTMYEFETSYWWYRSLHGILLDTLKTLGLGEGAHVLDAGCGTGQNLSNIGTEITSNAYGFDLSIHAAPFWARRGIDNGCIASINEIPYASEAFDAVMSVDVLECDAVSEHSAVGELLRVLKPSGHLVLVVPAYDWLLSEEHHRAVRATRRYSRKRVARLLHASPVTIMRMTHLFAAVLPAVALYRFSQPFFRRNHGSCAPQSELKPLNPAVNNSLIQLMNIERRILGGFDLPFGSSIMVVARKDSAA